MSSKAVLISNPTWPRTFGQLPATPRNARQLVPPRRDLRESLEDYSQRLGYPEHIMRPIWRAAGLFALGVQDFDFEAIVEQRNSPRIAPGVTVETKINQQTWQQYERELERGAPYKTRQYVVAR